MIYYQIISNFCFMVFIVNIAFLVYLNYGYDIPKHLQRYMFLSLLKNMVGAISQLYIFPYECNTAWYIKSFPFIVAIAQFTFCFDLKKVSCKKNSITTKTKNDEQ